MKRKDLFAILLTFSFLLLICTPDNQITGTVDDTDTGIVIALSGKVCNQEGKGVPNVITRLSQIKFSDTTDSQGRYKITITQDTLTKLGINLDTINDSVIFTKEENIITVIDVEEWIDTLPDVFIIQRNISGTLQTTKTDFKRIEAVISDVGDTIQVPKKKELWLNPTNYKFSGYLYSTHSVEVKQYKIFIKVFSSDSLYTGRSQIIEFPSTAGDIEFPAFDPFNAIPIPDACADDTISINDTLTLLPTAVDSFGGTIAQWEWNINGNGFVKISKPDTLITAPPDSNPNYVCVVRVTDNDCNTAIDSMNIVVCKDAPVANAGNDTTVTINTPVTLKGAATQRFGTTVIYKWDCNGDGIYDDSSATACSTSYTYTHEADYNALLYVRDDDGNEATDVRIITVGNKAPEITAIRPDTTISIKDSILFSATAIDHDGSVKEYAWDCNGDGTFEYINATNATTGYRFMTAGVYNAIVRAIDDDNKSGYDTAIISVLQDIPVVQADKDTTLSVNDTIRLHGTAKDSFGMIIQWEWCIGGNGFIKTSKPDTVIIAPAEPNSNYTCFVRVTDDDGNSAIDSTSVTVVLDPPNAQAGNDTTLNINTQYYLHGTVTQQFGNIVKWEWNIGDNGFKEISSGDTSIITPNKILANYYCMLKVTDDDGNSAIDTVNLTIGALTQMGSLGLFTGSGYNLQISDDHIPYIAYNDSNYAGKISVIRYNGTTWEYVGSPGISQNLVISKTPPFVFSNNVPYISFVDSSNGEFRINCLKNTGGEWHNATNELIIDCRPQYHSFIVKNNDYFILYDSTAQSERFLKISRYNNSWENVCTINFKSITRHSTTTTNEIYFKGSDNKLFLFVRSGSGYCHLKLLQYTNNTFEPIYESSENIYEHLAVDCIISSNNIPYISYGIGVKFKDIVVTHKGNAWQEILRSRIGVIIGWAKLIVKLGVTSNRVYIAFSSRICPFIIRYYEESVWQNIYLNEEMSLVDFQVKKETPYILVTQNDELNCYVIK